MRIPSQWRRKAKWLRLPKRFQIAGPSVNVAPDFDCLGTEIDKPKRMMFERVLQHRYAPMFESH